MVLFANPKQDSGRCHQTLPAAQDAIDGRLGDREARLSVIPAATWWLLTSRICQADRRTDRFSWGIVVSGQRRRGPEGVMASQLGRVAYDRAAEALGVKGIVGRATARRPVRARLPVAYKGWNTGNTPSRIVRNCPSMFTPASICPRSLRWFPRSVNQAPGLVIGPRSQNRWCLRAKHPDASSPPDCR